MIRKVCAAFACALVLAPAASAASGWEPTGAMATARTGAQAARLADGRVLVAGGFYVGEIPGAELYDPATGTWSAAAPPLVPRHDASLTRLPDGRLLLAGGIAAGGHTAAAELYDPVANTWTATGSMAGPRTSHVATLLPDGKVLVAGGEASVTGPLDTAELYDPATGTWSPAGTMATARENHVQELLADGRVLVAGGYQTGTPIRFLADAELYDPTSDSWSPTASMATARAQMAFARLGDGTVLAAGGINSGGAFVRAAERYDPDTATWSPAGSVAADASVYLGAALPDGRALVVNAGGLSANAALFAPASSTPTPVGSMSTTRGLPTVTTLADGRVLVAGGGFGQPLTSAEVYTPPTTRTVADADFGSLRAGGAAERDVTVTNSGGIALWVDSVALGGADAGAFAIVADDCGGRTVAAGASCVVRVRFTAAGAPGARAAQLTIDDNADGAPSPALRATVASEPDPDPDPDPDPTPEQPGPTPQQPAPPAPQGPAPPASTPQPAPPAAPKVCSSRRNFTMSKSFTRSIRSGTATLDGKVIARLSPRRRTITIDLRGRRAGTYTLRVTIRTKAGRTVKITRRYRTCVPRG